ncbi:MAG: phosphodiester glycosidase family protein [Bacteroidetes bacterium]|nr:MAG: phosphodiester glycosidase family protein [Bacteroidota bacterium]
MNAIKKILNPLPFILLLLIAACAPLRWESVRLAPGLSWRQVQQVRSVPEPQNIQVMAVDPQLRQLELAFVTDTFLPTSVLGEDAGALAAINAGFFRIREGRGSATYLRVRGQTIDDLPAQGHAQLNGALVLPAQGVPRIEYARSNAEYNAAPADQTVLVTGPVLLLDGMVQPLDSSSDFVSQRHPRTCLCTTARGEVLLVTVDGRHAEALGMSLFELTRLLEKFRCHNAINLDGGGSTTMWIQGQPENGVVNCPSDNATFDHAGERPVANAVIVH